MTRAAKQAVLVMPLAYRELRSPTAQHSYERRLAAALATAPPLKRQPRLTPYPVARGGAK